MSTISCHYQNHYGTYPTLYHAYPDLSQYIRTICCTGPVYNKTVLLMCSGIWANYEANGSPSTGPQNYLRYSQYMDSLSTNNNSTTIMMSTDPVSIEMQTIKMMRIQGQQPYATANMPNYLKASGGVVVTGTNWPPNPSSPTVMDDIGEIDEADMTVLRIINGVTGVRDQSAVRYKNTGAFVSATPITGHNSTFIEFALPAGHVGNTASIEIFDLKGKCLARLSCRVGGILNHLSWNESDSSGRQVGRGAYIVRLISGAVNVSSPFVLS